MKPSDPLYNPLCVGNFFTDDTNTGYATAVCPLTSDGTCPVTLNATCSTDANVLSDVLDEPPSPSFRSSDLVSVPEF